MAEELEHISSSELINRLDTFLGFPDFDPHGEPIPDCDGNCKTAAHKPVSKGKLNEQGIICGVTNQSASFLKYLEKNGLLIGTKILIDEINDFDQSVVIKNADRAMLISREAADNLLIKNE